MTFAHVTTSTTRRGGEQANASAVEQSRVTLKAVLAKALKEKNPERLKKMQPLNEQFEFCCKDFDKLITLRRKQSKLTKEALDPSGQTLRIDFEELPKAAVKDGNCSAAILAGEGLQCVMQARLNVNKLLGRHDESVAKSADKDFADLKPLLATFDAQIGSADMRRLFDEAEALVDTYRNAYVKASHDAQEIDVLVNGETMQMAEAIAAGAQSIKDCGGADEIEQSTASLIGSIERFVMWLAIYGLAAEAADPSVAVCP